MPVPPLRPAAARLHRVGVEVLGFVLAAAFSSVALAHALGGAKRPLLLTDGDSVLLPLLLQSAQRGEPLEWGMSPVLFVFPEIPLYLLSAALTTTVAASLLLNGVLNVVVLYALFRAVAGRAASSSLRAVVAALAGILLLTLLCLLETRPGGNTGELASLYLTTTYYSGTVMALVGSIALVLRIVGRPRGLAAPIVLGVVAALATLSNPLFALWATGPLVVALGALVASRRSLWSAGSWWPDAAAAAALVAGSAAGWIGRLPLQNFVIARKDDYFRWEGRVESLRFDRGVIASLVSAPGGFLEAMIVAALMVGGVVAAVMTIRRRASTVVTLAALIVAATVVVVPAGLFVVGSISTRYALPVVFVPLTGLVVAAARIRRPRVSGRIPVAVLGIASLALVVAAAPATGAVASAARSGDPGAKCLTEWAAGKHVAGAAQFWTGRSLAAYGGPGVRLVQVNYDLSVYPWLVNLASYRNAQVGYVVVGHDNTEGHEDLWGDTLTRLGAPRDIVACGTYDIYDYRGTVAGAELAKRVSSSVEVQAAFRGFGR